MRRALPLLLALSAAVPAAAEDRIPEFLKSDAGPRVHWSCFRDETPEGRGELKTRFDEAVREALARARACDADLKEMSYLAEVVKAIPSLRVACADAKTDPKFKDPATAAYTVHGENLKTHPQLSPLAAKDPSGLFVVTRDSLRSLLDQGPLGAAGVLFHEGLHHTRANSRWDHNETERVEFDEDSPCQRSKLDDRVIFLESVCGFAPSQAGHLLSRYRRCGRELACEIPLWMVANVPYLPSHPEAQRYGLDLMQDPAKTKRLCGRVKARLKGMAFRGEVIDREAALRLGWADRALLFSPMGLEPGIPPHYLEALSADQRSALAAFPGLAGQLDAHCELTKAIPVDGGVERFLFPIDEAMAPAECPLSPRHPARAAARPLQAFHEAERALQKGARGLLDRASSFPPAPGDDPVSLGLAAVSLFQRHCPPSAYEFRPALCDTGELILLSAFSDLSDLLAQ